jgi:hypothetical protein
MEFRRIARAKFMSNGLWGHGKLAANAQKPADQFPATKSADASGEESRCARSNLTIPSGTLEFVESSTPGARTNISSARDGKEKTIRVQSPVNF